jgi:hypothetical protein
MIAPATTSRRRSILVNGEDSDALRSSDAMRSGSEAYGRTADAIAALAAGDREGLGPALAALVHDFEQRREQLTRAPIADTAMMFERLTARRGIAIGLESRLLPAVAA